MGLTCGFIELGREKRGAFGAFEKIEGVQNSLKWSHWCKIKDLRVCKCTP